MVAKPKLIYVAFSQLRHCPRELSSATGLQSVQAEPEEQSKESDDTSTTTDVDSMIKEDTAVLGDEEPTTDDLAIQQRFLLQTYPYRNLLQRKFQLGTLLPMFQLSSLCSSTSANKDKTSDKVEAVEVDGMTIFNQEK